MSYTKEQTDYMLQQYEKSPTRETVANLAIEMKASEKSIIGKLSREGVYRREVYRTKSGDVPVTKLELVSLISEKLGLEEVKLEGLEKSPKSVLRELLTALDSFN